MLTFQGSDADFNQQRGPARGYQQQGDAKALIECLTSPKT